MTKNKLKIVMTGGGSGGPVTPLLAVVDRLRRMNPDHEFFWIGTQDGPEKAMVAQKDIAFQAIVCGKWRRYFSLENFYDIFKVKIGFMQALFVLWSQKPDLIMSAGGFVSVPVAWAGWFLRIPVFIHQQDVRPGLANKLMAPIARVITVTFEKSLNDYGRKAVWTGNPVRAEFAQRAQDDNQEQSYAAFGLKSNLPVILVIGGGTGSAALNMLLTNALPDLTKYAQIIHVSGAKKSHTLQWVDKQNAENYKTYDFLDEIMMSQALHAADVVVSRAGMGFLSELSYLEKAAILLPLPATHQIDNANLFRDREAALVLDQESTTASEFTKQIKKLLQDDELRQRLEANIGQIIKREAAANMAELVERNCS